MFMSYFLVENKESITHYRYFVVLLTKWVSTFKLGIVIVLIIIPFNSTTTRVVFQGCQHQKSIHTHFLHLRLSYPSLMPTHQIHTVTATNLSIHIHSDVPNTSIWPNRARLGWIGLVSHNNSQLLASVLHHLQIQL